MTSPIPSKDVLDVELRFDRQERLVIIVERPPCQHCFCDWATIVEAIIVEHAQNVGIVEFELSEVNRLTLHHLQHFGIDRCAERVYARLKHRVGPDERCDLVEERQQRCLLQHACIILVGHVVDGEEVGPHTVRCIVQHKKPT